MLYVLYVACVMLDAICCRLRGSSPICSSQRCNSGHNAAPPQQPSPDATLLRILPQLPRPAQWHQYPTVVCQQVCVALRVALRCVASHLLRCCAAMGTQLYSVQAAARAQQLALTGAGLLGLSEVELMRTFDLSRSEAQVRGAKAKAHHCIAQRP